MNDKIRIILVDDHLLVRTGFNLLLNLDNKIEVIGEASRGEEAIKLYQELKPDIIVMDINMPGIGGMEAIKRLVHKFDEVKILVLSAHDKPEFAIRALNSGAYGYLTKRTAPEELISAIKTISKGSKYIESKIAEQIMLNKKVDVDNSLNDLTPREFEVFIAYAKGKSVIEIAKTLSLSTLTIGTHITNTKQKLGVSNQAGLARIAFKAGLIDI